MEISEIFSRVGQQENRAGGNSFSDHLKYFCHNDGQSEISYQSVNVRTLSDQIKVTGVRPLMK